MRQQHIKWLVMLLLSLLMLPSYAKVLVLVHGYLGGAYSWEQSGIGHVLESHGWQHAGLFVSDPAGVRFLPANPNAKNKVYTVDFPSEAPIRLQADQLHKVLAIVNQQNPDEDIILVGHSAGGVVARLALVTGRHKNVTALITIASPHLGTERAEQALDVTSIPFPIAIIPDVLGGETYHTLKRSQGLYVDLLPARPGSLLFWLNQQPHPEIKYYSIMRGDGAMIGDILVPGFSQDMNNVPALRGRSQVIMVATDHSLDIRDGMALLSILNK